MPVRRGKQGSIVNAGHPAVHEWIRTNDASRGICAVGGPLRIAHRIWRMERETGDRGVLPGSASMPTCRGHLPHISPGIFDGRAHVARE